MDLKLTPSSSLMFFFLFYIFACRYLLVEWQEVTKRSRPVRLGVGGVPPGKHLLQEI